MIEIALRKAIGRLQTVAAAIDALAAAQTDSDISEKWIDFVTAWKATYTKVQQAAKSTPQELQWWGAVKAEGKSDPVLRYIFAARNDEEHGLVEAVNRDPATLHFEMPVYPDRVSEISFRFCEDGQFRLVDTEDGNTEQSLTVSGGGLSLQTVTERDGSKVAPPTLHLGQPIDPKPLPVAQAGFRYLEALVGVAVAMHKP